MFVISFFTGVGICYVIVNSIFVAFVGQRAVKEYLNQKKGEERRVFRNQVIQDDEKYSTGEQTRFHFVS